MSLDTFNISSLSNKIYMIIGGVWLLSLIFAYSIGVKEGFIPKHIQCKDNMDMLAQCKKDKADQQKVCTSDLIKCQSECKINTCESVCTDKVKNALDSYKRLLVDLKCGSK
jgi:hypothetical protein